jgi:hypothetical protein
MQLVQQELHRVLAQCSKAEMEARAEEVLV